MSLMQDRRSTPSHVQMADVTRRVLFVFVRSVRTAAASPVPVDMVCMVRQTAALVVESGHAAHLPDIFPTLVGAVDSPAHIFERDSVTVVYMI